MLDELSLHPRNVSKIIGHKELNEKLNLLHDQKVFPHALLFHGQKGVGKASLAYKFASLLLDEDHEVKNFTLNVTDASLIKKNTHPNVLVIEAEWDEKKEQYKNSIGVDKVREIQKFLLLSSINNKYKIVIIDSIDIFTLNASNALLKILEAPPKKSIFLIINHNINNILDTIKSRCNLFAVNNLTNDNIIEIAKSIDIDTNKDFIKSILDMSEGSMEKFLWFFKENNYSCFNIAQNIILNKMAAGEDTLQELCNKSKKLNFNDFEILINLIVYNIIPIHSYFKDKIQDYEKFINRIQKLLFNVKIFNTDYQIPLIQSLNFY